jgi:mannose-6-phosphate isomerase-like protein (cupin superfamily)
MERLSRQHMPINLTETTDGMSWREACETFRIVSPSQTAGFSIQPIDDGEGGRHNDSIVDIIYVVVSGYGVVRFQEGEMECTVGDVLLIPRGNPHQLERFDGAIRIWMIELTGDENRPPNATA